MIFSQNGKVFVQGSKLELMKDIACAIQAVVDNDSADATFLHHAVDLAFMTEEEIEAENEKIAKDIRKQLEKLKEISDFVDKLEENDEDTFKSIFGDIL